MIVLDDGALIAVIGAIQALGVAYINVQVRRYACGGARCIEALKQAQAGASPLPYDPTTGKPWNEP